MGLSAVDVGGGGDDDVAVDEGGTPVNDFVVGEGDDEHADAAGGVVQGGGLVGLHAPGDGDWHPLLVHFAEFSPE